MIGMVISSRMATLHELQTVYSVEDVHNLIEVMMVDAHNSQAMAMEQVRRQRERVGSDA